MQLRWQQKAADESKSKIRFESLAIHLKVTIIRAGFSVGNLIYIEIINIISINMISVYCFDEIIHLLLFIKISSHDQSEPESQGQLNSLRISL